IFLTCCNEMTITKRKNKSYCDNGLNKKIENLLRVYSLLENQKDLSPNNDIVNFSLKKLVHNIICWQQEESTLIEDIRDNAEHLLLHLPALCARAECEMEKWWCRKILSGQEDLEAFWYYENYQNLIDAELDLLSDQVITDIVFLGSGALPLSAILLAQQNDDLRVKCIDYDIYACDLAKRLIKKLKLDRRIEVCTKNSDNYIPQSDELIICASLLKSKNIYYKFYKHDIHNIIVRDVEGLYQLLYTPALMPTSEQYIEQHKTPLSSIRINTSRCFERVS
ncbi:MAG: nicotianamine synthase family protein, partial [Pseudomonadota bacterium]